MDVLPGLTGTFGAILIDPPWRFQNRTGKMAPEHKRLRRYATMSFDEIAALPVARYAKTPSHLYLWCPNALLPEALGIMARWGFKYKSNIVWYKIRKDGGPDGRGVGFYFRNVTELLLFGVRGSLRTLKPGARRSTSSRPGSRSIRGNRRRCTGSSSGAVRARTWNCSPASASTAGPNGATKWIATCNRTTRRTTGTRSFAGFLDEILTVWYYQFRDHFLACRIDPHAAEVLPPPDDRPAPTPLVRLRKARRWVSGHPQ